MVAASGKAIEAEQRFIRFEGSINIATGVSVHNIPFGDDVRSAIVDTTTLVVSDFVDLHIQINNIIEDRVSGFFKLSPCLLKGAACKAVDDAMKAIRSGSFPNVKTTVNGSQDAVITVKLISMCSRPLVLGESRDIITGAAVGVKEQPDTDDTELVTALLKQRTEELEEMKRRVLP